MDGVWIAIITAIVAPTMLALIQQWFRRQESKREWARQDEVAAKLLTQQAKLDVRAEEAALQLRRNNIAVAVTAAETQGQLRQIHTLVNGTLTAAMLKELEQREIALALMLEMSAFKVSVGRPTPIGVTASIDQMTSSIADLRETIAGRVKQEANAAVEARNTETKIEKIKRDE